MPAFIDLSGQQFGRWVVIERDKASEDADLGTCWKVRCVCGNTERTLTHKNLKRSSKKDICRCYRLDIQQTKHSKGLTTAVTRARKPSTFRCGCGGIGIDRGYGMKPSQCDDCRTKRKIITLRSYKPGGGRWDQDEIPPRIAASVLKLMPKGTI